MTTILFPKYIFMAKHTLRMERINPRINLGGVQLIPTATTLLQDSAIETHSNKESPTNHVHSIFGIE